MKRILVVLAGALVVLGAFPPAQAAKVRDRQRPRVTYVTADQAIVLSNPLGERSDELPLEVFGRATDNRAVAEVEAVWVPCTTSTAEACTFLGVDTPFHDGGPVDVSCHHQRRECTWRAAAPTAPGTYWFVASATDRAGNESRGSGILRVTVL